MDFNERVRKLLGLEREKTMEQKLYERVEEEKWQDTKKMLEAICEADDVDFEVTCTFIDYCNEEESYWDVSYNILPVYKQERFHDDKLQLEVGYKDVIIDKEEGMDDDIFITLNIDSESFKHKPDKKQTAAIQKRMSSNKKQVTITEFISAIEEGRSFKAASFF